MKSAKIGPLLIPILFWVILMLLNACKPNLSGKTAPKAIDGILDLTGWDFDKDGPVALSGKWAFYWFSLLQPDDFAKKHAPVSSGLIDVPGAWNGFEVNGEKLPGEGYATYRLQVLLQKTGEKLAFKFRDMAVAFSVYVNGNHLTSSGLPGKTRDTTVPRFRPHTVEVSPEADQLDVIIHVSNFHHRKGGAWDTLHLGVADDIRALRQRALHFNFFLFGSILIMGIYHMGIFTLRNEEKCALYFGLYCFLIAFRTLLTGERFLIDLLPTLDWEVHTKIEYLTFYLGVPAFAGYFKGLFPKECSIRVIHVINIVGGLFSVIVLLTPARLYTHTAGLFQIFTLLAAGYGFYALILALKHRRQGALVFLAGFVILFVTLVNDILYSNMLVNTGYMIQFGLFAFLFSQVFLLSFRISGSFTTVEVQRAVLEKTNASLNKEIAERKRTEAEKIKLTVQLQQVQKMEAIATLAGGIAHQFNNAISVIVGYIELLDFEFPQNEKIGKANAPIRDSVKKMSQLTDQLLAYARGGKYDVKELSIGDFIGRTLPLILYNIKSTVSVQTDISHDISRIMADETQMQMVMSAIISNASEAIDRRGCISITGRNIKISQANSNDFGGLQPGSYVSLTIEDDGNGMDEETRKRVFEPFFTTKFEGRGLGMAAVYGVIINHGGWISIRSAVGDGTRVRLCLPAI